MALPDDGATQNAQSVVDARFADYAKQAHGIVGGIMRGRSGFGALRNFDSVYRATARLILQSSFISLSVESLPGPMVVWHRRFWHHVLDDLLVNHRFLFSEVLTKPSSFEPHAMWAMFWGLAKAEHEFLRRYIPFWSHEERLTGHLVSQIVERMEEFSGEWRALSAPDAFCRIWYADTATARQERETGADFGLIVHAKYQGQDELFKAVRFQAKKVSRSGRATLDLRQMKALTRTNHLGYYVFYHPYDARQWSLMPTVKAASELAENLKDELSNIAEDDRHQKLGEKTVGVDVGDSGLDFASFVTFAVADPAAEHGVLTSDAGDAVRVLMSQSTLSRVMVISIGQGASIVDWTDLFGEYLPQAD